MNTSSIKIQFDYQIEIQTNTSTLSCKFRVWLNAMGSFPSTSVSLLTDLPCSFTVLYNCNTCYNDKLLTLPQ